MSKVDLNFVRSVKGIPYPNIIIGKDELKKGDLEHLSRMLNTIKEEDGLISILYKKDSTLVCLGELSKGQVSSLADIFPDNLTGYLDANNFLEDNDDVVFVLGTSF